ncbi:MAG TPA: acyl-CoA dehydrogenase family protein [Chloroflexota bacterium]|nr:acyl-CoA dehydrogenase family protein [Chloroflexota bacterium]
MTGTATQRLLDATRAILPLVRASGEEAERERRLPQQVAQALAEAGITRMLAPRVIGGLEIDPITQLDVIEQLAHADGSAGWNAQVYSSCAHVTGFLAPEVGREIFGRKPNTIMSGTLAAPYGRATVVDGGYRVTGRWPYASGCQSADWLGFTTSLYDGDRPRLDADGLPKQRIVIVPASDVNIHDTWHVSGLRGTGSHDVEVEDVFVPAGWAFWWTDTPFHPGPLYKHRWWVLAHGAQRLGVARAAIDALYELAQTKTPTRSTILLRDRSLTRMQFAQAEALLHSARAFLWDTTSRFWERVRSGDELSTKEMALARLANTNASIAASQIADLMFSAAGGTAIHTSSPLERLSRDAHAAAQHATASVATYEQWGRLLLHTEPETLPPLPGPPLF